MTEMEWTELLIRTGWVNRWEVLNPLAKSRLTTDQYKAWYLREYEFDYATIGRMCGGISAQAAKGRVKRARRNLRPILSGTHC